MIIMIIIVVIMRAMSIGDCTIVRVAIVVVVVMEIRVLVTHYYNLFSFERLNFGQKVTLNEVYAVVESVPGVDFAVVRKFCRRDAWLRTQLQSKKS